MNRIGTGLLKQSKDDKSSHRRDLLSILAQANTMEEKAHQMTDEDVKSRAYKTRFGLVYLLIYSQRSLLSSSLVMNQQGIVHIRTSDILQLEFTDFWILA